MTNPVAPDFLPDLKAYLRAQLTTINGRVFFRIPTKTNYPLVRIYRSGGGIVVAGDRNPIYDFRVGVEVWGNADSQYDAVRQLVLQVEGVLNTAPAGPLNPPTGQTWLANAIVTAFPESPDPDTGYPRFVGDLVLSVRHT